MGVEQLTLGVRLEDDATFANFYEGDNQQVFSYLKNLPLNGEKSFIYLHGRLGVGRSHLLQACCHRASEQGQTPVYLPLAKQQSLSPQILEGMETRAVVCLDDIECIAGKRDWEEALFHFYNRLIEIQQTHLIIAGLVPPIQLPLTLADLSSRLSAGIIFQVNPLTDDQKIAALQMRAKIRGLELSAEVGHYLLRRCPRDMHALFSTLEKLDQASLTAQRKLTVPFVKMVL